MGDMFRDHLESAKANLQKKGSDKFDVSSDRCFIGFDAYKQVIDSGVDLVILATPPGFRPIHLEAAIAAGKHVFTEKPVGVDPAGIRKVLAAAEEAQKKGLAIVAGTQRRHQAAYLESMKRIKDGALGELVTARVKWDQGNIWANKRQPGWDDMTYQMRNWYHFTWLCGDCIVEQHVHNLDVALWALGAHPVGCIGQGGQQVNTAAEYGESFDHFAVDYEFPNGVHVQSMARQIAGCANEVAEHFVGTKGRWGSGDGFNASPQARRGRGRRQSGARDPYVQEHVDLLESISTGKPINELQQVAHSTLTAIMGRMSAFTGQAVTWDQALNSKLDTFPATLEWGPRPRPSVAKPGQTELI